MSELYTHYYANSRHDGFINAAANCTGKVAREYILPAEPDKFIEARLILASDNFLVVDAMTEIFCLDDKQNLLWRREKYYGSPIVISNGLIYFQSPARKDRMEAVDFQNRMIISDFVIFEIIDGSFLRLFEPTKEGLIANVQYTGMPEVSSDQFIVYRTDRESLGYEWSKRYLNDYISFLPLVNFEAGFLVTSNSKDVLIFDIDSKAGDTEPKNTFPLPSSSEDIFVSSDKRGLIYFGYCGREKIVLKCFDSSGKEIYETTAPEKFYGIDKVIAPPILANDYIYLLSAYNLVCFKNTKVEWQKAADGFTFSYATALSDNSILVARENILSHFDSNGTLLFSINLDDKITAPPVVNEKGRVFICTKSKIISIK
ncbi:MAG: hypothetical protein V1720_17705 [bacterium]